MPRGREKVDPRGTTATIQLAVSSRIQGYKAASYKTAGLTGATRPQAARLQGLQGYLLGLRHCISTILRCHVLPKQALGMAQRHCTWLLNPLTQVP